MRRKSLQSDNCPIARTLDRVGDWWSLLIVREAHRGARRFEEFRENLDISDNTLSRRLQTLVEHGVLERRPYQERPLREEYVLTDRGRDLDPVLEALYAWGEKWTEADPNFPPPRPHPKRETHLPV
jgi:DNA-binding HxlR family transcriptional regulator